MTQHLETVGEVIDALGGSKAIAEITGRNRLAAVWKNREKFPAATYTTIKSALDERGLSAPNKLWGMP